MNETIMKIEKVTESYKAGYAITTDIQVVKLLIDDESSCCESWGYFLSEDDTQKFIGSKLLDISLTDTALKTHQLKEHQAEESDLDAGGIMFVNIHTSIGLLQFVAYNAHNGYYGHVATVTSSQLNHEEVL